MGKVKFILLLNLVCTFTISQEIEVSLDSTGSKYYTNGIKLIWENDCFVYTDYYFTNGVELEYYNEKLEIPFLNILLSDNNLSNTFYSVSLKQNIYTPINKTDVSILQNDRPYAGYLIVDYRMERIRENRMLTASLSLGVIGNYSGGYYTQKIIHESMNFNVPAGWEYQVNNAPIVNLNYRADYIAVKNNYFSLRGNLSGRIGSLYTDAGAGVSAKTGYLKSSFSQVDYMKKSGVEVYFYANSDIVLPFYDATLQGSLFLKQRGEHFFNGSNTNMVIAKFDYGAALSYNFVSLKANLSHISPEFKGGKWHAWGALSIFVRY